MNVGGLSGYSAASPCSISWTNSLASSRSMRDGQRLPELFLACNCHIYFLMATYGGSPEQSPGAQRDLMGTETDVERAPGDDEQDPSTAEPDVRNLSKADLYELDLSGADLSGANLSVARLDGCDLSGALLTQADLSGAILAGANLTGADLSGANLSWADLGRANLTDANLRDANMEMTITIGTRFNNTTMPDGSTR
jgi:hypothetical protein